MFFVLLAKDVITLCGVDMQDGVRQAFRRKYRNCMDSNGLYKYHALAGRHFGDVGILLETGYDIFWNHVVAKDSDEGTRRIRYESVELAFYMLKSHGRIGKLYTALITCMAPSCLQARWYMRMLIPCARHHACFRVSAGCPVGSWGGWETR